MIVGTGKRWCRFPGDQLWRQDSTREAHEPRATSPYVTLGHAGDSGEHMLRLEGSCKNRKRTAVARRHRKAPDLTTGVAPDSPAPEVDTALVVSELLVVRS